MTGWKVPGPVLLGIAVCSVSTTPIVIAFSILHGIVGGQSVGMAIDELVNVNVAQLFFGWAVASLAILPMLVVVALIMRRLGRTGNDTLVRSVAAGSVVVFVSIVVVVSLVLGEGPGWSVQGFLDMAAVLLMSAAICALYWVIAVRPSRRRRALLRQTPGAVRAME